MKSSEKCPKLALWTTGFFGGALVFWAPNVVALWADFLWFFFFFHREEGCCVVRLHTEGNDVSRALRKHSKNWCFVMCHKKNEGIQKSVCGNCTGLWSLRNLPPAPQGSKAADQTWGNFKNTVQNLGFFAFSSTSIFHLPLVFFEKKNDHLWNIWVGDIFFFNMSR